MVEYLHPQIREAHMKIKAEQLFARLGVLFLVCGLFLFDAKIFAAHVPEYPNVLNNGSFEEDADQNGIPDGWKAAGKISLNKVRSGQSAAILSGTPEQSDVVLTQSIPVPEPRPIAATLRTLIKTNEVRERDGDSAGSAVLRVGFLSKEGTLLGKSKEHEKWEGSLGWRPWSSRVRIPEGAASLELSLELKGALGNAFFDDVQVFWGFPEDYDRANLLTDGGFEYPHPLSPWNLEPGQKMRYPGIGSHNLLEAALKGEGRTAAFQEFVLPETLQVKNADIEFYLKLQKVAATRAGGGVRVEIHFMDLKNRLLGKRVLGPWTGGKSWDSFLKNVKVPKRARKGIFFFIMENAQGSALLDHVRITGHADTGPILRPLESVTDTKNWKPFQPAAAPLTGALDASGLLDAPAGKHGFLKVGEDGHFYFEDGTRARFFGINLQSPAAIPTHENARAFAERFAQLGFNLVRLHHLDAPWALPPLFDQAFDDTQHFSAEALDRLDYFISELKKRGIYIYLDLFVSRKFKKGDGVHSYLKLDKDAKSVAQFDPRILELEKKFAHDLLTHENPYTQKRFLDEPAIVLTEIANENSLCRFAKKNKFFEMPSYYLEQIRTLWLQQPKDPSGAEISKDGFLDLEDPKVRKFFTGLQDDYFSQMHQYLRGIGLKIPIAGSNLPLDGWDLESNAKLDFIDRHSYWDPPMGGYGDLVKIHNALLTEEVTPRNLVTDAKRINPIVRLAGLRVAKKPFVVGEWNIDWPNEYRAAGPFLMAAYASFQDWDAIIQFNFEGRLVPQKIEGNFDISSKPEIYLQIPLAARLFYRQHAAPALTRKTFPFHLKEPVSPGLALMHRLERSDLKTDETPQPEPSDKIWISDTKELKWNEARGLVRIVTPKTQALAGRIPRNPVALPEISFTGTGSFAALALTSLDDQPLTESRHLLLSAFGRSENTGTAYNSLRTFLRSSGTGPILLEPVSVRASLRLGDRDIPAVFPLDAYGRRKDKVAVHSKEGLLEIQLEDAGIYEIIWESQ